MAAEAADARHWAALRADATEIDDDQLEKWRHTALLAHRGEDPEFVSAAQAVDMDPAKVAAVEDIAEALTGVPEPQHATPGGVFLADLKMKWVREAQPRSK